MLLEELLEYVWKFLDRASDLYGMTLNPFSCSRVVPTSTILLFYCNLILICNTLCLFPLMKFWVYETQAEGIVLSFYAHAHYDQEACGAKVKVHALGVIGDCWTCHVMMNHSYFSLDHTLDYMRTHDQADSGEQCFELIW